MRTGPFLAVASDLFRAREVWLRTGDLVDAVRASTAIPGIMAPVWLEGRWLMDGGMTNPVPVSACRALGADIVIAIDPNSKLHAYRQRLHADDGAGEPHESAGIIAAAPALLQPYLASLAGRSAREPKGPGYFTVLSASIDLMTDQIRRSRFAGDPPHVIVMPDLSHQSILEFHRADEAIAAGYRAMLRRIDEISELL